MRIFLDLVLSTASVLAIYWISSRFFRILEGCNVAAGTSVLVGSGQAAYNFLDRRDRAQHIGELLFSMSLKSEQLKTRKRKGPYS